MRTLTALLCSSLLLGQLPLAAQQAAIAPQRPAGSVFVRPYSAVTVPAIRTANSQRMAGLIRAGNLYLSLEDAIALALENNIDLEIARYNPVLAEWRLQRAQAGGLLPGVPSSAAQAGSVAAGQGVTGSQAAAGITGGGFGGGGARNTNQSITQIGPVTQTLDPIFQQTTTFTHSERPQSNTVQSRSPVLISDSRVFNNSIQQGLLTGGSVNLGFRTNYLEENSPTNILNPSTAANLSLSFQHNLLRGLGRKVNERNITVSKINVQTSDIAFKSQVIAVVNQVVSAYIALAASQEDLKAKQLALDVAETLRMNAKRQVEIGVLAQPELTRFEAQEAQSRLALVTSETTVAQQELRLKNLLSRNGVADPALASAHVILTSRLSIPEKDDLPPIEELVKKARANRPDLQVGRSNLEAAQISAIGTANGVLPNLQVFGAMTNAGLAGTARPAEPGQAGPDPFFVGGFPTAAGQVFRRNFPTDRIGAFISVPVRNRQAQSDYAIDQLQYRQSELSNRKALNRVEVDVMNAVVALRQARARYESAQKNRVLQEQLLRGEQTKFDAGASTAAAVIQLQRDLAAARFAEVSSLASYNTAKAALDQVTGSTLEANSVAIAEARDGQVARESKLP